TKLRSDWVMPSFLAIVVYVAFLMSYTWETLTLTTIGFFLTLPFSARAWKRHEAADAAALAVSETPAAS
ncbi:MAG: CDP-diacylglycerol--serine O-phosphatidyltransferase, partial [Pyrinomonadaceae bacterium]